MSNMWVDAHNVLSAIVRLKVEPFALSSDGIPLIPASLEASNMRDYYARWGSKPKLDGKYMQIEEAGIYWATARTSSSSSLREIQELLTMLLSLPVTERTVFTPEDLADRTRTLREMKTDGKWTERIQELDRLMILLSNTPLLDASKAYAFNLAEETLRMAVAPGTRALDADLDLFDSLVLSPRVPFASIKLAKSSFVAKLDAEPELVPPMSWLDENDTKTRTMVLKVFSRNKLSPDNMGSKASYIDATHKLGSLEFVVPYSVMGTSANTSVIASRLARTMPSYRFAPHTVSSVSGWFGVRRIKLVKEIFATCILKNDVFRRFFYFKESSKSLSFEDKVILHANLAPSISFRISFSETTATQGETLILDDVGVRLDRQEKYVRVGILGLPTVRYVSQVKEMVMKLIAAYSRQYAEVYAIFAVEGLADSFPKDPISKASAKTKDETTRVGRSNLDLLQSADPDLFPANYASKCQPKSQPTPIAPEDVVDYLERGYQVVKYPAPVTGTSVLGQAARMAPFNYYVSLIKEKPFLGLVDNDLPNKTKFPYLLCAYSDKSLHIDPDTWNIEIIKRRIGKKQGGAASYVLDSSRILDPDRLGTVRSRITNLFKGENIRTFGIAEGTSSLLHCAYFAVKGKVASEEELADIRLQIVDQHRMELSMQEKWDMTLEAIAAEFVDPTHVLDSAVDRRLIEAHYDINFLVIKVDATSSEPEIEVPRHNLYHSTVPLTQDTGRIVIVYKHVGASTKRPEIGVHHELIVAQGHKTHQTLFAGSLFSPAMFEAWTKTFECVAVTAVPYPSLDIEVKSQINIVPDVAQRKRAVRQVIDVRGRCIKLLYGGGELELMPPAGVRPFDLPASFEHRGGDHFTLSKKVAIIKSVMRTLWLLDPTIPAFIRVDPTFVGYDVSSVPRAIPTFTFIDQALEFYGRVFPDFIKLDADGTVWIAAQNANLAASLAKVARTTYDLTRHSYIRGFYSGPSDFVQQSPRQMVFASATAATEVFLELRDSRDVILPLPEAMAQSIEPHVVDIRSELFLLQPAAEGSRAVAAAICVNWIKYGINSGFQTEPDPLANFDEVDLLHSTSHIAAKASIVVLPESRGYAALLKL
jgi:hypothetical protein